MQCRDRKTSGPHFKLCLHDEEFTLLCHPCGSLYSLSETYSKPCLYQHYETLCYFPVLSVFSNQLLITRPLAWSTVQSSTPMRRPSTLLHWTESPLQLAFNFLRAGAKACCMCGDCPMEAPFSAPCTHIGCWKCWLPQLARSMSCPVCSASVRQKQLSRAFFT